MPSQLTDEDIARVKLAAFAKVSVQYNFYQNAIASRAPANFGSILNCDAELCMAWNLNKNMRQFGAAREI